MEKAKGNNGYLKSKLFIKLFMSYIIFITLFFSVYSALILYESATAYKEKMIQEYDLKIEAFTNAMDFQILSAKHIVSTINTSETIKKLYSYAIVEDKTMDSLLMYQVLGELKKIKSSGNNLDISNIIILFNNYDRIYTGSSVIQLAEKYDNKLLNGPNYSIDTASNLLSINNVSEIVFNKEFFIYRDNYYYASSGSIKGTILVLFTQESLKGKMKSIIGDCNGLTMYYQEQPIVSFGDLEGRSFQCQSTVNKSIAYEIYVNPDMFHMVIDISTSIAIVFGFIVSLGFVIAAYVLSKKYYSPFGNIERIIENNPASGDEIENIMNGIQNLIGERNGYREKMITISPYVKQGVLHGILSGNMEKERLKILSDEQYMDLKKPYFVLAIANIAYKGENQLSSIQYKDVIDVIQQVCMESSTEETQVVSYIKDINNVFLIANSDLDEKMESLFFILHDAIVEELDDEDYMITIGVSQVKDDINSLNEACQDANIALDNMLTGGRNAVYFYENENVLDKKDYYFPKDAVRRVAKSFKERNILDLKQFLDEIYEKNMNQYDASPGTIRLLIDELHIVSLNALKTINAFNTTHVQIDKIDEAVTIEEIFAYYYAIYETICNQLEDLVTPNKDIEKLNQEIILYINENFANPDMSLALLGEKFGVSNKYISLMCKNFLGDTYLQYVQEKRIEYAGTLLKTTENSLEQIAQMSGYTNMLTFRRNFKSIMGMNPSDYR